MVREGLEVREGLVVREGLGAREGLDVREDALGAGLALDLSVSATLGSVPTSCLLLSFDSLLSLLTQPKSRINIVFADISQSPFSSF